MPTYEYLCEACSHEFTLVQSLAEHGEGSVTCPQCGSDRVRQVLSSFMVKTSRKS